MATFILNWKVLKEYNENKAHPLDETFVTNEGDISLTVCSISESLEEKSSVQTNNKLSDSRFISQLARELMQPSEQSK